MIIENGKRYVRADGEISGVMEPTASLMYPHHDPVHRQFYYNDGRAAGGSLESGTTLVSEYIEPIPQYGPWIPWAGGECPVAAGVMGQVQLDDEKRTEVETEEPDLLHEYNWPHIDGDCNIIYYRVLIEEPKAVKSVVLVHTEPGPDWQRKFRKAIITAQGDNIKAEWAPKEDKE